MSILIHPAPAITHRKPLSCERVRVNWEHPLNSNLVAWWVLNEGIGPHAINIVNLDRAAFKTGAASPTWSTTKDGPAVRFAAASSQAIISQTKSPVSPLSVVAYFVASTDTGLNMTILSGDSSAAAVTITIETSTLTLAMYRQGDAVAAADRWTTAVTLGQWEHRAATWNTDKVKTFYTNGLWEKSAISGGTSTGIVNMELGSRYTGGSRFFDGLIGYCAVYSRILNQAEVFEWYEHPYGTPSNPRLLVEPRRTWFTLSQPQGAYHRYPTINY